MTAESNRGESDIELSSDESRCLEDIDAVLSPDKTTISNFIYSNDLWTTPSLSSAANSTLTNSTNNHDDDNRHDQQQMITLKPVSNEPLSPTPTLIQDGDINKTVAIIHRRPMLVAFTDPRACSPTGPTHFKCTQCHEIFDSLLLGQEHANNGMCTLDATVNVREFNKKNKFDLRKISNYPKEKYFLCILYPDVILIVKVNQIFTCG